LKTLLEDKQIGKKKPPFVMVVLYYFNNRII